MRRSWLFPAMLLWLAFGDRALAQTRMYRWVDADGRVHVTDTPPPPSAGAHVPIEPADQAILARLEDGLTAGDVQAVVPLFRYFEEVVGAQEAATDRTVMAYFLNQIQEAFGRAAGFDAVLTPSARFMSARIESASADQWNASECLYKTYTLKTTIGAGETAQPAELVVTLCTGPRVERPTLRQIDYHLTSPTAETPQKIATVLTRTIVESRRLRASASRP